MEPQTVDTLARLIARRASRRQLLRAGLGFLAGSALLQQRTAAEDVCNAPFILCDDTCDYSLTSNEHCGMCDHACADLVCIDGVCSSCEAIGMTTCDDPFDGNLYCADLSTDLHCGSCGNVCTTGPCVDGTCSSTVECEIGFTECWGTCVDLQTDTFHCGTCFIACAGEAGPGESSIGECVAGVCQLTCLQGYTMCDDGCRDLSADPSNCGACGNLCTSAACLDGICTEAAGDDETDDLDELTTTLPATGNSVPPHDTQSRRLAPSALGGMAAMLVAIGWRQRERVANNQDSGRPTA